MAAATAYYEQREEKFGAETTPLKVGDTLMLNATPDSLVELRAGSIPWRAKAAIAFSLAPGPCRPRWARRSRRASWPS